MGVGRSGAALGFQQTVLGVFVSVVAARVRVARRPSWRLAFFAAASAPCSALLALRRVPEVSRSRAITRNVGDPAGSSLNSGLTQPSSPDAVLVARLDLGPAHRQRPPGRPHGAESLAAPLGLAQHLEVDLGLVDLLHAADEVWPCSSYA